jgi:hypothetical protein
MALPHPSSTAPRVRFSESDITWPHVKSTRVAFPSLSARFAVAPLGTDPAQPIAGKHENPDGDGNDQATDDDRSVPQSRLGM